MPKKREFTVELDNGSFDCYLEDGKVHVLDDDGHPVAISSPTGINKIADAKEAAKTMIAAFPKRKTRKTKK